VTAPTYLRYEILRTYRNRRFLVFSLIFPLVLYFAVAGSNRHLRLDGISFPLYYMTAMAAWGTMLAVVSGGARIAAERSVGWTRQMRITPLPVSTYFGAKVLSSYLLALLSILVLSIAGTILGVRLTAADWALMVMLLLIGLVPFAVLGIMLGHLLTVDSLGPAVGGATSLLALIGGAFGPIFNSGALLDIAKVIPSYWLVQAGKSALGAGVWPAEGWIVIVVWTALLGRLAVRVYARDTGRV